MRTTAEAYGSICPKRESSTSRGKKRFSWPVGRTGVSARHSSSTSTVGTRMVILRLDLVWNPSAELGERPEERQLRGGARESERGSGAPARSGAAGALGAARVGTRLSTG